MANGLLQTYGYGEKPGQELTFTGADITGMPISLPPERMPVSQPTMPIEQVSGQSPSLGSRAMGILGSIGGALGDIGGAAGRGLVNLGGGVQQFFQDRPDLLDTLSIGFGGMSMRPNEGLIDLAKARIAQREVDRQEQATANRTAQFLRSQGYDDLAQIVLTTGNADVAMTQYKELEARKNALPSIVEIDNNLVSVDRNSGKIEVLYESPPEGPDAEQIANLRRELVGTMPVKNYIEIGFAYDKVAKTPATAAGDLALVFNYMKLLDPGSVVRESEFRTASQARAWLGNLDASGQGSIVPANVRAFIQGAREGTILLPEQRQDFKNVAKTIFEGAKEPYERQVNFFRELAIQQGINPDFIITDYGFGSQRVEPPLDTQTDEPPLDTQTDEDRPYIVNITPEQEG